MEIAEFEGLKIDMLLTDKQLNSWIALDYKTKFKGKSLDKDPPGKFPNNRKIVHFIVEDGLTFMQMSGCTSGWYVLANGFSKHIGISTCLDDFNKIINLTKKYLEK